MNQKNKIFEQYVLLLLDLVSIVIVFISSTYIRFGNFRDMGDKNSHFMVCLCFLLFTMAYAFFVDGNKNFSTRGYYKEFVAVGQFNVMMLLVVGVIMYFLKWTDTFSRLVMGYFLIGNTLLTYLLHLMWKKYLRKHYASDLHGIHVLVIGQSDELKQNIIRLKDKLELYFKVDAAVCFDQDMRGQTVAGVPIVADRNSLFEVARQMPLDEVLISLPDSTLEDVNELVKSFDEMGIVSHRILDVDVYGRNVSKIEKFGGYKVITCSPVPGSIRRLLVKRIMDIAGGIVGLLITAIVTPFVAVAIKLDSKGPVFFSQIRVGRNGRRFKIYKFRSMYMDAEERKKELENQNEVNGLMFKMENDPRITKVGHFIRKTSIDELPQFWNVLKGDMSLVGTRPPTQDEFEKYNLYYRRRLSMTPGLTGMWQVSGRSDIDNFDDVVKLDLQYIDEWSLGLDIKIILQTIVVVFAGRGSK